MLGSNEQKLGLQHELNCRDHGTNPSLTKRSQREGQHSKGLLEALRKVTTIDSGMSPWLYRRNEEQGNEWQPWRFNFWSRLSPTLVGVMLQYLGFIAQCMGYIVGTIAADETNDWPFSSCCVRQLGLPRGDYSTKMDRVTEATLPRLVRIRLRSFPKHTHVDGRMDSATASRTSSRWL